MFPIIRTAALSAVVALGAIAAVPAAAQASGGLYLGFGSGQHAERFGFHFDKRGRYDRRPGRDHEWRPPVLGCSPRAAVSKASDLGLRRARVVHAGPRTITVQGRLRGHGFAAMTFARAPHCPRIR